MQTLQSLFPWQLEAYKVLAQQKKLMCSAATGSGKTFFAIRSMQLLMDKDATSYRVLIVVPKNVILEHTWIPELQAAGVPVSRIGTWYGGGKSIGQWTVTNMQSFKSVDLARFDILILDECHHATTEKQREIIMAHQWTYMLGLSATVGKRSFEDWELLKLFGYQEYRYETKDAMDEGILAQFTLTNVTLNLDSLSRAKYELVTAELGALYQQYGGYASLMRFGTTETRSRMLALLHQQKHILHTYRPKVDVVIDILKEHVGKKVIVFSQYNMFTSMLKWKLLEVDMHAEVVHSGVEKEMRAQSLERFAKGETMILLTSKVLDEGYNLSTIDVAIIVASDGGERQTVQRLGRILRKKDRPAHLYQVACAETVEHEALKRRNQFLEPLALTSKTEHRELVAPV